MTFGEKI